MNRQTQVMGAREDILTRWGRWVSRRRGVVALGWIVGLALVVGLWQTVGGSFRDSFTLPGSESQRAADLLESRFPQQAGDSATIVLAAPAGLGDPAIQGRVEALLAQAADLPGVVGVGSPFEAGVGGLSADGTVGYATVRYGTRADEIPKRDGEALLRLVDDVAGGGLTVEAGGRVVELVQGQEVGNSELVGLGFAVVILLVAFGSVIAMGLPLATALISLVATFALLGLGARFLELPSITTQFAALIGLGVGIDYALLIVTRFREGLHSGLSVEDAVARAIGTAGRSVLFAGIVVCIALLGLYAVGIPFVGALGGGGALIVAMAVLVSLTLLPALLALVGQRVDRWRLPFISGSTTTDSDGVWYRFASVTQRRPVLWALGSLAVLIVLSLPLFSLTLGSSDAGNGPTSLHTRRAYDLLAQGFGPGFNGPLTVAVDLRSAGGDGQSQLDALRGAFAATAGVAQVSPAAINPDGDAAVIQVTPSTSPQDAATGSLIHTLRDGVIPATLAGSGVRASITGPTAATLDIADRNISRLPLFFAAVLGLSFLLLTTAFRSPVVALKATIMNLLSISASFGVLVAVFQWGWSASIVGVREGPIESFLPMMLFAVLFGLSMDYEVFLISRIRERYLGTRDTAEAVAHGIGATARVITAAAAIMVAVFLSFVLGDDRVIKEFGLGLAAAILIDATIVRLVLVPATMELLGSANWWMPRWLHRVLPHLDVDGEQPVPAMAVAAD